MVSINDAKPGLPPRLLHFRLSHYNEKVRWALDHKSIPHTRQAYIPAFHFPFMMKASGQTQTPVLMLDCKAICGSGHILSELERLYPDHPLFPTDPAQLKKAAEIQDYFDNRVGPEIRRIAWGFYFEEPDKAAKLATQSFGKGAELLWRTAFPAFRPMMGKSMGVIPERVARAKDRMGGHLDKIISDLEPSGYLVGDKFSVADLTVCSILSSLARPPQFPYLPPEPEPVAMLRWREEWADHEGVKWILKMYEQHRPPSCEINS